jgi:hypothetical protein
MRKLLIAPASLSKPQARMRFASTVKKAEKPKLSAFSTFSAVNAYFFSAKYPGASCGKIA